MVTPSFVLKKQVRTTHFWMAVVSLLIYAAGDSGVIPSAAWAKFVSEISPLLLAFAYQGGALWQPPRKSWSKDERHDSFIEELKQAGKWPEQS